MSDDLATLRAGLTTRWLGHSHEHHTVLGSTNDRALAWAREGAPHGALVTADEQTAGRGRRGRTWCSTPGLNLYTSVVLHLSSLGATSAALSLAVAVGLREGLDGLGLPPVDLKWPNDLLIEGRKLGGILCESRWQGPQVQAVVGFGVNLHQREFPPELEGTATSFARHGVLRPRAEVLASLLEALEDAVEVFLTNGFAPLRDRYVRHCPWLGERLTVEDPEAPGQRIDVFAEDVSLDGRLLVRDAAGRSRHLTSGEVWLTTDRGSRTT